MKSDQLPEMYEYMSQEPVDERTVTLIKHLEDHLKKVEAEKWLKLAEASAKALYKFCPNCGHSLNA